MTNPVPMTTLEQFESESVNALSFVVQIHSAVRKALALCDEIAALRGGNEGDKLAINTLWEVAKHAASEIGEQARGATNNAVLVEMTTVEPFTTRTSTNKPRMDSIESCASVTELRVGEIEAAMRLAKRIAGQTDTKVVPNPANATTYRPDVASLLRSVVPDSYTSVSNAAIKIENIYREKLGREIERYQEAERKKIDGYRATYITPDFWTSYTPEEQLRRLREALEEGAVVTHRKHWPLSKGPAMGFDAGGITTAEATGRVRKAFDERRGAV